VVVVGMWCRHSLLKCGNVEMVSFSVGLRCALML
jgi:hypothetical protein